MIKSHINKIYLLSYIPTKNKHYQNKILCFDNVYFGSALGLAESLILSNLIYPIPSSDNIFLNSDIESDAVIFNSLGEQIFRKKVKKEIDISKLEKGIYFLHLSVGANNSIHKIVKD